MMTKGRLWWLRFVVLIGSCVWLTSGPTWGEAGFLVVHVSDVQRHPITGLQIGVSGDGGSSVTDDDGKARIKLASQTKEKSWVSLQILKSPQGRDYVMVSPWDSKALVPLFENESENYVEIVVVQRGDRAALENGTLLAGLTARIVKSIAAEPQKSYRVGLSETFSMRDSVTVSKNGVVQPNQKTLKDTETPEQGRNAALTEVAASFGMSPEDVDQAIRAWGAKTTDPYEAGLAAIYEKDYSTATEKLSSSFDLRLKEIAKAQEKAADAAFFLGQSLYAQGKYREAASAYQQAAHFKEADGQVLNNWGLSLIRSADYANAEPILQRALASFEKTLGSENPRAATVLSNLANLYRVTGNYAKAEPLYRRALQIDEKVLGPESFKVSVDLNNLAGFLEEAKADYAGAEPLYRRALEINESALGPNNPEVATDLVNLAELLLRSKGDFLAAEPLCQRAIAIDEAALGSEHPEVATDLGCLAAVSRMKRDYVAAETLYRRALGIEEKTLGPDHPDLAKDLGNLGGVLEAKGDLTGAEASYRKALMIAEKALGPDHPSVAVKLNNLAWVLYEKQDYAGAEPLYRRALSIDEKAFGRDHPEVAKDLINLADLLHAKDDLAGAVAASQQALTIYEKSLGPDHPQTRAVREQLRELKDALAAVGR